MITVNDIIESLRKEPEKWMDVQGSVYHGDTGYRRSTVYLHANFIDRLRLRYAVWKWKWKKTTQEKK